MEKIDLLGEVREILELQAGLLKELAKLIEQLNNNRGPTGPERLLPVREAAKLLGVAESTLRRLIAQGEIRSRRVGGKVVVPSSEIQRIAQGN